MMITILIYAIVLVMMLSLAIMFSLGKGSSLIAGLNTMPEDDKAEYDTVALCKFMGKMMFALSFSVVLWMIAHIYDMDWLFVCGLILFIGIVIYMITYVNTGNRFKKHHS